MNAPNRGETWLGLDIGGANIKAAHSSGAVRTVPFELWKRPEQLPGMLKAIAAALPPADRVAVTMTAELCDCYATKTVGVNAVLDAVESVFDPSSVSVWGIDATFRSIEETRERPLLAAAANWMALAMLAARLVPEGPALLIDIGTTTTDLIPLDHGRPVARGTSDLRRLQTGELVYAGIRRTPIAALATELPVRGISTGLAAELFASTLDIYLTLGDIPSDPHDLSTADGRPATPEAARDRLARMVGADRDDFTAKDAREFAIAADRALMTRLILAGTMACLETIGKPRAAVIAGAGSFLARRLAERLIEPGGRILSLDEAWGPVASSAGCAYAIVELARDEPAQP